MASGGNSLILDDRGQVWGTGLTNLVNWVLKMMIIIILCKKMKLPKEIGTIIQISASGNHTLFLDNQGQV